MKRSSLTVEFRCPKCNNDRKLELKGQILCDVESQSNQALKCKGSWPKKDAWKLYVVVRRCISKADYEFYEQLPTVPAERDEAVGRS